MKFDETMLSGYIDGELSDEERKVVEKRLAESPKDRELLRALTEIHTKLSAMPEVIFRRDPVQGVRDRIAAERARPGAISQTTNQAIGADDHLGNHASQSRASASDGSILSASPRSPSAGNSSATLWWSLLALAASVALVVGLLSQKQINILADNAPAPNSPMPATNGAPATSSAAGTIASSEAAPRGDSSDDSMASASIELQATESEAISAPGSFAAPMSAQATAEVAPLAAEADSPPSQQAFGGAVPGPMMNKIRSAPMAADMMAADSPVAADLAMAEQAATEQAVVPGAEVSRAATSGPVQVFAIGAPQDSQQPTDPLVSDAELVFDPTRSIAIEVPEGYTDDALRMIVTLVQANDASPSVGSEASVGGERGGAEFEQLSSEAAAVLVKSSPERLSGLIQAMRKWSQQVVVSSSGDRAPGTALAIDSPMRSGEDPAGAVASIQSQESPAVDAPRAAEQFGELSPGLRRSASSSDGFQLGSNAESSLREGQVWILILPTSVDGPN